MAKEPSDPPKIPPSRGTKPYKFDDGRGRSSQQNSQGNSGGNRPVLPPPQGTKPYKNGM